MQPLVRYPGGKHKSALRLAAYFDPSLPFLEPFAGGAAVTLAMRRRGCRSITIGDLAVSVVNLWSWVRDDVECLIEHLPAALDVDLYRAARRRLGYWTVQAAAAKVVVLRGSQGARGGGPIGGWQQNAPTYLINARWNFDSICRSAREHSAALQNVNILHMDGVQALRQWPDIPAFVDPPYVEKGHLLYADSLDFNVLADVLRERSGDFVLTLDNPAPYADWCTVEPSTTAGNGGRKAEFIISRLTRPPVGDKFSTTTTTQGGAI